MDYLEEIDITSPEFGDFHDELPLWSAPFGLLLLDRAPIRREITVLDVGAGTGFMTLELAQRCGPTATVIAVDPWTAGMSRLRRKLERLGLTNVRLIEGDAAALDLPDSSVDLIVSNLGINNFQNAGEVLRTCCRIMKREGRLLLTTNLVGHMRELYDVYRLTLVEMGFSDRLAALDAHIAHRGTVESVTGMLQDSGFEVADIASDNFRIRFADGSSLLRHHLIRLGFLPAWKAIVDAGSIERTFVEFERRLNAVAAERGELALNVPIACFEARKTGSKPC
jgi:arsenite methyltransferase